MEIRGAPPAAAHPAPRDRADAVTRERKAADSHVERKEAERANEARQADRRAEQRRLDIRA